MRDNGYSWPCRAGSCRMRRLAVAFTRGWSSNTSEKKNNDHSVAGCGISRSFVHPHPLPATLSPQKAHLLYRAQLHFVVAPLFSETKQIKLHLGAMPGTALGVQNVRLLCSLLLVCSVYSRASMCHQRQFCRPIAGRDCFDYSDFGRTRWALSWPPWAHSIPPCERWPAKFFYLSPLGVHPSMASKVEDVATTRNTTRGIFFKRGLAQVLPGL